MDTQINTVPTCRVTLCDVEDTHLPTTKRTYVTGRNYRLMRDAIELLGGEALPKLTERGHTPLDIALAMIGGPEAAANLFGVSRQELYRRKKKWPVEWYLSLERATGIPPKYLTVDAKGYGELLQAERKRMQQERQKIAAKERK